MNQISELLQSVKIHVQSQGLDNVLELLSIFENYDSCEWENYLQKELKDEDSLVFHQDHDFKLLLIRWDKGKKSKIHGHPQGGGLIKVLSGALLESRFDSGNPQKMIGQFECKTGQLSYIHDELGFHIIENPYSETAISLHLYTPGIYAAKIIERTNENNDHEKGIKSAA